MYLQLESMRTRRSDGDGEDENGGLFLGAFGWVDGLTPDRSRRARRSCPRTSPSA